MPRLFALISWLFFAALLGACDFLPQNGTEWGVALGIFGVLFIAVVYLSWKNSRKPKS